MGRDSGVFDVGLVGVWRWVCGDASGLWGCVGMCGGCKGFAEMVLWMTRRVCGENGRYYRKKF